jgi:SAM-dependent methyltransferase
VAEADRERWDRRHEEASHGEPAPPDWLAAWGWADEIPTRGRALDVASGSGRYALWLARRGLDTLAVDVSPVALERLAARAAAGGLAIATLERDLEAEPPPPGPFDVIACAFYLQRDLFPRLRERLAPGGVLLCELPTSRNLERHERPSARFLVEPNELLRLVAPLEIVAYREGWLEDRSLARVLARSSREPAQRPGPPAR